MGDYLKKWDPKGILNEDQTFKQLGIKKAKQISIKVKNNNKTPRLQNLDKRLQIEQLRREQEELKLLSHEQRVKANLAEEARKKFQFIKGLPLAKRKQALEEAKFKSLQKNQKMIENINVKHRIDILRNSLFSPIPSGLSKIEYNKKLELRKKEADRIAKENDLKFQIAKAEMKANEIMARQIALKKGRPLFKRKPKKKTIKGWFGQKIRHSIAAKKGHSKKRKVKKKTKKRRKTKKW